VHYAAPRTHCAYFMRICTIPGDSERVTRTGQLFMRPIRDEGTGGDEDTRIRLGCRFIGRKILDLLISLVRHVGFVLSPARNLPRASEWRADSVFVSGSL